MCRSVQPSVPRLGLHDADTEPMTTPPNLPARTPGAAPAIRDAAITGSAFALRPARDVAPVEHNTHAERPALVEHGESLDPSAHPLTSADLSYRYSKEQATAVATCLRHLSSHKPLADLTDADLGLVTVTARSLYDTVCTDLAFSPR